MKLYVPTNWQHDCIRRIKRPSVVAVFGKLDKDFAGGGRPSCAFLPLSRQNAINHVQAIHKEGLKFYYLMNASCLGNKEWTISGHAKLKELLSWIIELKADGIVVANPYIFQYARKKYPSLEVSVSCLANVNSVEKAKYWDDLGASMITVSQVEVNRNFRLLEQMRRHTKCGLQILVNDNCLADCPIFFYHTNVTAHASQQGAHSQIVMFDYCKLFCRSRMLSEPVNFIRNSWIRPEDLKYYEDIGIDRFKIVDRTMTTDALERIVDAYECRSYKGNLFDLLLSPEKSLWLTKGGLLHKLKYFAHPFAVNIIKTYKNKNLADAFNVYIDNAQLDGFMDHFLKHDCRYTSCSECGYCQKIADKVVKIDEGLRQKAVQRYNSFLKEIVSGGIFEY